MDFIEVINSPTSEDRNPYYDKKALEALDILWCDGHKIFAVAGSDNHGLTLGDSLNYIRLDKYTSKNILENLKKGRTYISRVGETKLRMENDGKVIYPGDEVDGNVSIRLFSSKSLIWKVIKNGRVIERKVGQDLNLSESIGVGAQKDIKGLNIHPVTLHDFYPVYRKE